jgi:hypothetical protein
LNARLDLGEGRSERLQFLSEPRARAGVARCPRRGLQSGPETLSFGQKRSLCRGIAAEALNGSTDMQGTRVEIDIRPL